jgi:Bbp16-like protein
MILDAQNLYSDAQALTATAVSTNIIDHGADGNLGIGEPMCVLITVDVALDNTTTNETYTATLETDDNAAFTSATAVSDARTLTAGSAAGTKFVINVPPNTVMERFSRLTYTLGGTTPTATLTAALIPLSFLANGVVFYNDAITIS